MREEYFADYDVEEERMDDEDEMPDWEEYPGTCRCAIESVNWTVLELTKDFQKEVFDRAKSRIVECETDESETVLSIDYEELCAILKINEDEGSISIEEFEYMESGGAEIVDLLNELGYELECEGTKNRHGFFGVFVIR